MDSLNPSHIVVYDTEYTAWDGSEARNWSEPWEHREIIQIAALKVDANNAYQEVDAFECVVRPFYNPELSDYIIRLTGLTQTNIEQKGILFKHALHEFHKFCSYGRAHIYSWGGADHEVLMENCQLCGLSFPEFPGGFFDIRKRFSSFGINTASYNSGTVYQSAGLSLKGKQHNAMFDVRSMVASLAALNEVT